LNAVSTGNGKEARPQMKKSADIRRFTTVIFFGGLGGDLDRLVCLFVIW
jgi:hypothetical protein